MRLKKSFLERFLDLCFLPLSKLYEKREDVLPEERVDYVIGFGIGMRKDGEPSLLSRAVASRCVEIYKSGKC